MTQPERRRSPRYEASLAAQIPGLDSETGKVTINALSRAGLQVHCNGWVSHKILTLSRDPETGRQVEISVELSGILADEKAPLTVPCHVIASRRLSEDAWDLVMEYSGIDAATKGEIDRYISSELE